MNEAGSGLLEAIFPGDSHMSCLMRSTDWTQTPLGDPAHWPDGLKIPLRMLLTSRFEMWLGWGPDLLFFYNDAYIPTLGIKHPSMLGKPFRDVWSEVYAQVEGQVVAVARGQATWNEALLLLLERSGYAEETYHSFSYSPLHEGDGRVGGLLCIVNEETERVINERYMATLRMLAVELAGAADHDAVRHAVCSVLGRMRQDFPFSLIALEDGAAERWTPCCQDVTFLPGENWPPRAVQSAMIVLPQDADYPYGPWERAATQALHVPIPGFGDEASMGSLFLGLNPFRGQRDLIDFAELIAGQVGGALANVAALQAERRRADRMWEHSRDLMVVIGADGVFRSASPAWTRILGHGVKEVVGRHFEHFMAPEDVSVSRSALEQAVWEEDLTGFENRLRAIDGEMHWISWHTAREDGLVYAYGRDITEEKLTASALAETEAALRQSQKMEAVGQLTGGIAHDFNNLLTGIIGSLEVMERRIAQGRTDDVTRYSEAAKTCANRAAAMTQRLLAFSRRQSLDTRRINVTGLVRSLEELLRRSIGERIDLDCLMPADLWAARCDANQLESAILNLAINARDAMPKGGKLQIKAANVTVTDEPHSKEGISSGQYVTLAVLDSGAGMNADTVSRAFEPFFTTKPLGQGTGLGLSMIYGFMRQSGGFVTLESMEGQGTSVVLFLPRDILDKADGEMDLQAPPSSGQDHGGTVLVVEDEQAVRELVVDILEEQGYLVMQAIDGPSGLDALKFDGKVDLLVTDVGLPGLNGRQLADAARLARPELKILFMTGYAHNAAGGNDMLQAGMELITKPFSVENFLDQIRSIMTL